MNSRSCQACLWWDNQHPRLKYAPTVQGIETAGFCRKHKPGAYTLGNSAHESFAIGIQPITDANDYCGEYREVG